MKSAPSLAASDWHWHVPVVTVNLKAARAAGEAARRRTAPQHHGILLGTLSRAVTVTGRADLA